MSWTEYEKVANVEAILVEDVDDVPEEAAAHVQNNPFTDGGPHVVVHTDDGMIAVELPTYICRYPGATDHAWPCNVEDFEDWYQEVDT